MKFNEDWKINYRQKYKNKTKPRTDILLFSFLTHLQMNQDLDSPFSTNQKPNIKTRKWEETKNKEELETYNEERSQIWQPKQLQVLGVKEQ